MSRGPRRGSAHQRPPVCGLPRALRRCARARPDRRARAQPRLPARARPGLLHAHHVRVQLRPPRAPRAASAAAAGTTASSSRSAGGRRRAWGWGSGLERISLAMREPLAAPLTTGVFVAAFTDEVRAAAFACAQRCAGPACRPSWTSRGAAPRASSSRPGAAAPARRAARPRRTRRRRGAAQGPLRRRGGGRRRRRPPGARRRQSRERGLMTLRDSYPGELRAADVGREVRSPAGWRAAATTAASSSSTCVTAAGWSSSWSPRARRRGARARRAGPHRVRARRRGKVVARSPETVGTPSCPTGDDRGPGRRDSKT